MAELTCQCIGQANLKGERPGAGSCGEPITQEDGLCDGCREFGCPSRRREMLELRRMIDWVYDGKPPF